MSVDPIREVRVEPCGREGEKQEHNKGPIQTSTGAHILLCCIRESSVNYHVSRA